jgi:hypothetical protein
MMRLVVLMMVALFAVQDAPSPDKQDNVLILEGRVLIKSTGAAVPGALVFLSGSSQSDIPSDLPSLASLNTGFPLAGLRGAPPIALGPPSLVRSYLENLLRASGGAVSATVFTPTDRAGRYSFRNLAPGTYTVRVAAEGFFGPKVKGTYQAGFVKTVDLNPNKPIVAVDALLAQGVVVKGKVKNVALGQSLRGIPVEAFRLVYKEGVEKWEMILRTTTGESGGFEMMLPPGETYFRMTPRDSRTSPRDVLDSVFYDNVTEVQRASKVVLIEGAEAYLEFITPQARRPLFQISGTANNAYGPPNSTDRSATGFLLARRDATVLDPPYTTLPHTPYGPQRATGEFSISRIEAGIYDLIPYYTDRGTGRTLVGRALVELRAGNATAVAAPIHLGFTLSGEISRIGPDADAIKPESLLMKLESLGPMPSTFVTDPNILSIDTDGRFLAYNVPDERYRFRVAGLPPSGYLADIKVQGQSVFDEGLLLSDRNLPVQVVLSSAGQTVSGSVRTADGREVENATVVLIPPEGQQRKNPMRYRVADTNSEGRFRWQDVPVGEYTVLAWESVLPTAWMNVQFLEKYKDRARTINVTAGSFLDLQLPVIP